MARRKDHAGDRTRETGSRHEVLLSASEKTILLKFANGSIGPYMREAALEKAARSEAALARSRNRSK